MRCYQACQDNNCIDQCTQEYYSTIYGGIYLFSLEKESKLTFDPLYLADLSPFEEVNLCKRRCDRGDFICIATCNAELQKRLDGEVSFSLNPSDQVEFQAEMKLIQDIFNCYLYASSEQEAEACVNKLTSNNSLSLHSGLLTEEEELT